MQSLGLPQLINRRTQRRWNEVVLGALQLGSIECEEGKGPIQPMPEGFTVRKYPIAHVQQRPRGSSERAITDITSTSASQS